jgi:hypothetical protein
MYVKEKVRQRDGVSECERGIARWRKREVKGERDVEEGYRRRVKERKGKRN